MKFVYQLALWAIVCLTYLVAQTSALNCTGDTCIIGKCIENGTCVCDTGYTTYGTDGKYCNYEQKEKLTAFLLSFFIGSTGADWFYLSRGKESYIVAGIFKLLTGFCWLSSCLVFCCIGRSLASFKETARNNCFGVMCGMVLLVIIVICSLANMLWTFIDWIRVAAGDFKDGNGVALKDW